MKQMNEVGTNSLLKAAEQLKIKGEISEEQYQEMVRRNNNLPKETKVDTINLTE